MSQIGLKSVQNEKKKKDLNCPIPYIYWVNPKQKRNLQLLVWGFLSDIHLTIKVCLNQFEGGYDFMRQYAALSKVFLVSKFHTNWLPFFLRLGPSGIIIEYQNIAIFQLFIFLFLMPVVILMTLSKDLINQKKFKKIYFI